MENTVTLSLERYDSLNSKEKTLDEIIANGVLIEKGWFKDILISKDSAINTMANELVSQENKNKILKGKLIYAEKKIERLNNTPWYKRLFKKI